MSTIALMKQIQDLLAPYDAKVLDSMIASIPERRAAVQAVQARSKEFDGPYGSNQYAHALIDAAGGKQWREWLQWGNADLKEKLTRMEAAKAAARAGKIAAKLNKIDVKEIVDANVDHTTDGFNGWWKVVTDQGVKYVKLEVIGAGGYNIQCYHYRCLVKVVSGE